MSLSVVKWDGTRIMNIISGGKLSNVIALVTFRLVFIFLSEDSQRE